MISSLRSPSLASSVRSARSSVFRSGRRLCRTSSIRNSPPSSSPRSVVPPKLLLRPSLELAHCAFSRSTFASPSDFSLASPIAVRRLLITLCTCVGPNRRGPQSAPPLPTRQGCCGSSVVRSPAPPSSSCSSSRISNSPRRATRIGVSGKSRPGALLRRRDSKRRGSVHEHRLSLSPTVLCCTYYGALDYE